MIARLGRNTLWLLLMRIGTQGLMVLFTLLIARRLGETGLGEYAFVASVIFVANVLTTFGADMLLIREIAAGSGLGRLPTALIVQLGLSLVAVTIVLAGAPNLPGQSPPAVLALQIYSLSLFPLAFYTVFTSALRGVQRMDLYTLLNLAISIFQTAVIGLFVGSGVDVAAVALWLLLTQCVAASAAGLLCTIYIPDFWRSWHFSANDVFALIRASAPIALLGLLGMVYQKLSIFMLATSTGAAMTGWFAAALRAVEACKTGHLAAFGALYPAMAQARDSRSQATFTVAWRWLLGLATASAFGLFIFAPWLVSVLFGPTFAPSIPALKILAWILIPYTVNTYLSLASLAAGRERAVALSLLVALATLIVLNVWWIRTAGLAGACWAALVAEVVQSICLLTQTRQVPTAIRWFSSRQSRPDRSLSRERTP
jgi:O-antigen/teichoic acid export membrane protein